MKRICIFCTFFFVFVGNSFASVWIGGSILARPDDDKKRVDIDCADFKKRTEEKYFQEEIPRNLYYKCLKVMKDVNRNRVPTCASEAVTEMMRNGLDGDDAYRYHNLFLIIKDLGDYYLPVQK